MPLTTCNVFTFIVHSIVLNWRPAQSFCKPIYPASKRKLYALMYNLLFPFWRYVGSARWKFRVSLSMEKATAEFHILVNSQDVTTPKMHEYAGRMRHFFRRNFMHLCRPGNFAYVIMKNCLIWPLLRFAFVPSVSEDLAWCV